MNLNKLTANSSAINPSQNRFYSLLSWSFLLGCIVVSIAFLLNHGVIQSVKSDVLPIEQLESVFYPGVYWALAASCITLLALSALLIGLNLAMAVVRTYLHVAPCRFYWWVLAIQIIPWLFFFGSNA